ncbi:amino acid ABC transporter substrate-binding protein [Thalassotalea sp. M1531]|uniref:Amino acid ABC transporter substrate-binding protein n=1 Tax=Thalassotalea algicola TaxID=2716224 RepID=A0A7Y0Q4T3_9GAMM|nr:transporter substrate-binding domain-containing protein [Thalassotalea algicola]NMP30319.1 amino acid ABC transporter substrate-binding protein [Thalassotalea algicola]
MKFKRLLYLLLCFAGLAYGNTGGTDKETIIINDINWPPYFMPKTNGGAIGLGKELITECLTQLNYPSQFKSLPIQRTHGYMKSGDIDLTVYSHKADRESFVYYGKEPIFSSEYGFAVKQGSGIQINKIADIQSLIIGHLSGLSHTPEILSIIEQSRKVNKVREGYSVETMLAQLTAQPRQFDILPNSKSTLYWYSKVMGLSEQVTVLDYTVTTKNYFLTVSKKSKHIKSPTKFLGDMDLCLIKLKQSGKYHQILASYGFDLTAKELKKDITH